MTSRNSRSYSPSYSEPSLPVTPNTPYYFHGQAPTQQDRKRKLDPSEKGQKSQRQEKKIKTQKVFETHNITSWEQIEPLIEGETATTKKRARVSAAFSSRIGDAEGRVVSQGVRALC